MVLPPVIRCHKSVPALPGSLAHIFMRDSPQQLHPILCSWEWHDLSVVNTLSKMRPVHVDSPRNAPQEENPQIAH